MSDLQGYKSQETLYQSSRTKVFRAIRKVDQKPVIIKILVSPSPSIADFGQYHHAFNITLNLDIKGVCKTYDLIKANRYPALVMEDIDGCSLAKLLQKRRLTLNQVLSLAIQISKILSKLHDNAIIHKDIKPANIIFNEKSKQVQIIDFGLASRIVNEKVEAWNPLMLQGTLAYISPEQTGRINRSLDHRSDLYSFGITLYEMLCHIVPFRQEDPLSLIHNHIAVPATPPHMFSSKVPKVLSDIVMKLISKTPEQRYQSAYGLQKDLEHCLFSLQTHSNISTFSLAQHDRAPRLQISQKLYGREKEVTQLLSTFKRVSQGSTELLFVSGSPGVGKTSLVQELHRPVTESQGHMLSGKYNPFQNIPYVAIIHAFRQLLQDLLSETEENLGQWKEKIEQDLGGNAALLFEALPELKLIIGSQPSAPELPIAESKNRFQRLLQQFLQCFASHESPLVLFLDDLQWAGLSDLELLTQWLDNPNLHHIMLVLAYRDNMISKSHPLTPLLKRCEQIEQRANKLALLPLKQSDVCEMIADTLMLEKQKVEDLTEQVYLKANGNPFFIERLLKNQFQQKLLYIQENQWYWKLDKIKEMMISDNVAELVVQELKKLPSAVQELLQLAACIGNQFDLQTLSIVSGKTAAETLKLLQTIFQAEIIRPLSKNYFYIDLLEQEIGKSLKSGAEIQFCFVHDRIQEATYQLVSEEQRSQNHKQIGKLLLKQLRPEEVKERLFDITNHLNLGGMHPCSESEREQLYVFNKRSGQKAMGATAYRIASDYFQSAISLQQDNAWNKRHQETYSLYNNSIESALVSARYELAASLEQSSLENATTLAEKIKVIQLRLKRFALTSQHTEAFEAGLEGLKLFGFQIPKEDAGWQELTLQEANAVTELLNQRSIHSLLHLPAMSTPDVILQIIFLTEFAPISMAFPHSFPVVINRMVRLSIQYGNHFVSPIGYVFQGFLMAAIGELQKAEQFGKLALTLNTQQKAKAVEPPLHHIYGCFIAHWTHSLDEALKHAEIAIAQGLQAGIYTTAGWAAMNVPWLSFSRGTELFTISEETEKNLDLSQNIFKYEDASNNFLFVQGILLDLMDEQEKLKEFRQAGNTEEVLEGKLAHYAMALGPLHIIKLTRAVILDLEDEALKEIEYLKPIIPMLAGMVSFAEFYFYQSLVLMKRLAQVNEKTKEEYLQTIEQNLILLQKWSKQGPENHRCKYLLLRAEKEAFEGNHEKAATLYDQAIEHTQHNGALHLEGLSMEHAASFYQRQGQDRLAKSYINDARFAYSRWGASKKSKALEEQYNLVHTQQSESIQGTTAIFFDMRTLLKSTQAISREIVLENLLVKLMQVVSENAGSERSCLLLKKKNKLFLEAEWKSDKSETSVLQSIDLEKAKLPQSVIRYVERTKKSIIIGNAQKHHRFSRDPHIAQEKSKSILCLPIRSQNRIYGILYLENNLATNTFTDERCALLEMLSVQIAISIENATLFTEMEEKVKERTSKLRNALGRVEKQHSQLLETQGQLVQSEKMAGLGTLVAGVAHEINNPANFTYAGAQNLEEKFGSLKQFIINLAEEDPEHEFRNMIEDKFKPLYGNLKVIKHGSERIKEIVSALRSFSRIDDADRVSASPVEGIRSTLSLVSTNYKDRVEFHCDLKFEPIMDCWPAQLNQVFMNLIVNGCKAIFDRKQNDSNAPKGQLNISSYAEKDWLVMQFQDNGSGIEQNIIDKIFEPFFTTREVGQGTGLGLSISYGIIEKHQGEISVESAIGRGSSFFIRLPLSRITF